MFSVGDVVRVRGYGEAEFLLMTHRSSNGNYAAIGLGASLGFVGSLPHDDLTLMRRQELTADERVLSEIWSANWSRGDARDASLFTTEDGARI